MFSPNLNAQGSVVEIQLNLLVKKERGVWLGLKSG